MEIEYGPNEYDKMVKINHDPGYQSGFLFLILIVSVAVFKIWSWKI